jgi:hypothetical protein
MDPIIHAWESDGGPEPAVDKRGSEGPVEADYLLIDDGRTWRFGCDNHD